MVIEMVMPRGTEASFSKMMDLQMMLLFGRGGIRTEEEFRALFNAAGLQVTQCLATPSPNSIIEGVRV